MKKIIPLLFLMIVILLFILIKFATPKKPYKVSLRLKWINQSQFAGYYVAKDKGYYKKEGLGEIEINPGGPDISPIQMVLSGVNNFGIIGADQVILARAKGAPVVAIAVIYKYSPVALASLKDSNIITPKDLIGKKVAIVYGKDEEIIYKELLKRNNIDRSLINEVPLTFDLAQLTLGKVDSLIVYEMNEPVLLKQKGYEVILIKPRDSGINFYSDTLFTTEKMIKDHPEEVRKFVKASIEGWNDTLKNPEEAVDHVLLTNKTLNREHQLAFLKLSIPLIQKNDIGFSDIKIWKQMEQVLINQKAMNKSINLSSLFTNEFLK